MPRQTSVLIACPNGGAWIHKRVAMAALRLLGDGRYRTSFIAPTWTPYVHNLHRIAQDVIKNGWDFLLTFDADNPPHVGNPLDLVEHGLDIVGIPTPVWKDMRSGDRPVCFNAMRDVSAPGEGPNFRPVDSFPDFKDRGLHRIDAVGSGCMLIARRVFVELFRRVRESGDVRELPFMRRWDPLTGFVEVSGDFAFCLRAKAAGFKVWASFDHMAQHFNELEVGHTFNSVVASVRKPVSRG